MGAWGVTARQSDYGLDMLALIVEKYLKPIDFNHFDVKGIMDFCKNHIIEGIKKEEEAYLGEDEDVQEYIDVNLPDRYNTVICLVAESLTEYAKNGLFVIFDYEANTERYITKFIYTDSVLKELLRALRKMFNPKSWIYRSWFDEDTRQEWISHMKMLCNSIEGLRSQAAAESTENLKKPIRGRQP